MASQGFVTKSEKNGFVPCSTTGRDIDPGYYQHTLPKTDTRQAAASFNTSAIRDLNPNVSTSATTPGVGYYDAAGAHDQLLLRHVDPGAATRAFNPSLPRMKVTDNSKTYLPGPGTYPGAMTNSWHKHSHNYSVSPTRQRLSYQKATSAPSIPSASQSFGYAHGLNGDLVMQGAADHIHTGEARDKVGPCSYSVKDSDGFGSPQKLRSAPGWANSKSKQRSSREAPPGPGPYDLPSTQQPSTGGGVVSVGGVDYEYGGASGSSQFVSKVPHPRPEAHPTPGPGSYTLDTGGVGSKKGRRQPKEKQCFGISSKRHGQVDPTKSFAAPTYYHVPGPGAYEESRQAIQTRKAMSEPQPFLSTTLRFRLNEDATPGPGEYKPDYVQTLAKDVEDKVILSRVDHFGSTASAPRFPSDTRGQAQASSQPGPGQYNPDTGSWKVDNSSGESSMFTSRSRREPPLNVPTAYSIADVIRYQSDVSLGASVVVKGDPSRLGPGCYLDADRSIKGQGGKAPFGVGGARSNPELPCAGPSFPSPGQYNEMVDGNKTQAFKPPKESVFGVQQPRFKMDDPKEQYNPGPGQYEVPERLGKKSYNTSFADQQ